MFSKLINADDDPPTDECLILLARLSFVFVPWAPILGSGLSVLPISLRGSASSYPPHMLQTYAGPCSVAILIPPLRHPFHQPSSLRITEFRLAEIELLRCHKFAFFFLVMGATTVRLRALFETQSA